MNKKVGRKFARGQPSTPVVPGSERLKYPEQLTRFHCPCGASWTTGGMLERRQCDKLAGFDLRVAAHILEVLYHDNHASPEAATAAREAAEELRVQIMFMDQPQHREWLRCVAKFRKELTTFRKAAERRASHERAGPRKAGVPAAGEHARAALQAARVLDFVLKPIEPVRRGRPHTLLLGQLERILERGGFTPAQVASLNLDGEGGAGKSAKDRMRKRIKKADEAEKAVQARRQLDPFWAALRRLAE